MTATAKNTPAAVPGTSIAEYSRTAAALAELAQKYKGVLFDVNTKEGLHAATQGRAELRRYRVDLEKIRVEIKAPALKRTQEIDSEARRITTALLDLETPIDDQIKADERRKKAEEEARLKAEEEQKAAEDRARREAEEKVLAAQRAEIERQQEELRARQRAQEEAETASRRKMEEERQAAVARIEAEQRAIREAREAEDRKIKEAQEAEAKRLREQEERVLAQRREVEDAARRERLASEERERIAREAEEARLREIKRAENTLLDARAMLSVFHERYSELAEFAGVVKAIDAYFKARA